jgi:pilus assembly protein Flp/PilA
VRPMTRLIARLLKDTRGATVIEYGLICSLVFLVAVGAMTAFGHAATNVFITAANAINGSIK